MKINLAFCRTALLAVITSSLLLAAAPAHAAPGYALSISYPGYVRASVPPLASNYSVSAWVFLRAGGDWAGTRVGVLSSTNCGGSTELLVRSLTSSDTDPQYFELGRCGWFNGSNSTPVVPLNQWVHLAVTVSSTRQVSYFINGQPAGSWDAGSFGLDLTLGGPNLTLGDNNTRRFDGMLDEVAIWNVARSSDEIQATMQRALSGNEPGLAAYWRFDEGAGSTAANSAPSGSACDGLLVSGPTWVWSTLPLAPDALTVAATALSITGATLNGTVNPCNLPTTAWFEWGADTNYGNTTAATTLSATNASFPLSVGLSNLTACTTYHFRLVATNSAGVTLGSDETFANVFPPSVVTLPAGGIGLDHATLNGTVNPEALPTLAWFEWGVDSSYGNLTSAASLPATDAGLAVSMVLSNLAQGQTYHFRVAATNQAGVTFGNDQAFATPAQPTITAIPDQALQQGYATGLLPFTIADADTPLDGLIVTAWSANPVLVPNTPQSLVLGGAGAQRTIQVVPATNYSGSATITVTVSDGVYSASTAFTVAVVPRPESSLLQFTSGVQLPPQKLRFRFQDLGTGATNYLVDFLPDLSPGNLWSNATDAVITALAPGVFQADVTPPPGTQGFYRLRGMSAVVASFNTASVDASAGTSEVDLVVVFNAPYQGTLTYTISGTAGSNDFTPLSGQVQVNGTTAAIRVTLRNDVPTGFTRTLILTLTGGPGFQLGATRRTTINLDQSQDDWQGAFVAGQTSLGFMMRILHSKGGLLASFVNKGSSFFPTNELPVDLVFTADSFAATVANIPVATDATSFNTPMMLTLQLEAANGQTNQTVNSRRVQGVASLVSQAPAQPHLNTTNLGTFLLIKPPAPFPTNQVDLVPAL